LTFEENRLRLYFFYTPIAGFRSTKDFKDSQKSPANLKFFTGATLHFKITLNTDMMP